MTNDEAMVVTQAMDAAIARREAAAGGAPGAEAAVSEPAPLPASLDSLRQRAWGKLVELLEAKVGSAPSWSRPLHLPTSCPFALRVEWTHRMWSRRTHRFARVRRTWCLPHCTVRQRSSVLRMILCTCASHGDGPGHRRYLELGLRVVVGVLG